MVFSYSSINNQSGLDPVRETLSFEVVTDDLPLETSDLVLKIKQVAESVLFHWRTFPIILPTPLAVDNDNPLSVSFNNSSSERSRVLNLERINEASILDSDNLSANADQTDAEVRSRTSSSLDNDYNQSAPASTQHVRHSSEPLYSRRNVTESNQDPRFPSSSLTPLMKNLVLRDIFVTPSFDELDAVAVDYKGEAQRLSMKQLGDIQEKGLHRDKNGKPKKLDRYQMEMVRQTGEFSVASLHFPNQSHVWRVSEFLQKGTERTRDAFLDDLATAATLLVITAKDRLNGNVFSLQQAWESLFRGSKTLIDLIFGIHWVQAHNLDSRIKEERCSYLVQELSSKDGDVDDLCSWMSQQIKRATREKFNLCGREKRLSVPYTFTTPQGLELNLRLFNRELMKKVLPILVTILEKESRGWFLHFREKTILQLKQQGKCEEEVEKVCNSLVQKEYMRRVYSSILTNASLKDLGDKIPELLVDQAKAVLLMHKSMSEVERIYEEGERSRSEELKHTYPILSRIPIWRDKDLKRTHKTLIDQHKWRPHEHALALCRQEGLTQHAYFLQRDLAFMREREPVLLKELQALKVPTRTFHWRAQIWFPSKFIVQRMFQGESEIIPTVVAGNPTTITTPRSDPNQPVYLLEKQVVRTTSTRWPLWRWFNFIHRSWAWTCNALFFLAVWVPMCSSFSFRALCSQEPFMPDFELSQVNGTVCPSKASLTPTLTSRLINLWRHISKSRTHFETRPDTGFLGKGVSRNLDRLYNYMIKGVFGTLMFTVAFPIACILLSISSILLAVTAPLWGPVCVVLVHLFFILVYDLDRPSSDCQKWFPAFYALFYDILLLGVVQPTFSLFCAIIICPLLAALVVLFALGRRLLRHIWDGFMYNCVIKKRGRVPASNSILVKRIRGPGMENDFVYQISIEQALASFEARLELDELAAFQKEKEIQIAEPLVIYSEFVQRCFGPFSGVLGRWGNFGRIEKEVYEINRSLIDKLERRRRELNLGLSQAVRNKIKMSNKDLKITMKQAVILLETFYPTRVLNKIVTPSTGSSGEATPSNRSSHLLQEINTLLKQGLGVSDDEESERSRKGQRFETEELWWESRGVVQGDFPSLASLIFTEIFSPDFLTPLEETNTIFQMEVQGTSLSRYTQMVQQMPRRTDLDEKITIHTPRGNIQVPPPYLDLSVFTPLARHAVPTNKTEKTSLAVRLSLRLNPAMKNDLVKVPEKLLIPPPVPHPAQIALIIYNRDATEPISLDRNLTKQVLRSIEDSPHPLPSHFPPSSYDPDSDNESASSMSASNASIYDQPNLYLNYPPAPSLSRTATLQMTSTLDRVVSNLDNAAGISSIDSRKSKKSTLVTNRSATLDSINSVPWLPSPLRSLLDSRRPFSVNLSMPHADTFVQGDDSLDERSTHTTQTSSPISRVDNINLENINETDNFNLFRGTSRNPIRIETIANSLIADIEASSGISLHEASQSASSTTAV